MTYPWKYPIITALFLCGPLSVSSQSTDFSSDLWVGHCNLEFLDARLYLIREVPYEEVPIIDLSVPETEE